MTLLLASSSPRRADLLNAAGVPFTVFHPDIDETPRPGEGPATLVRRLSLAKALAGQAEAKRLRCKYVLGADTVVALNGRVLGKPKNRQEAERMLSELSAETHRVLTGFAVWTANDGATRSHVVTTLVRFRQLNGKEIKRYVASGEADDKAGAYAIQGQGGALIDWVKGSYTNVIGLPVAEVLVALG